MLIDILCFIAGVIAASAYPPVGTFGSKIYTWMKTKI